MPSALFPPLPNHKMGHNWSFKSDLIHTTACKSKQRWQNFEFITMERYYTRKNFHTNRILSKKSYQVTKDLIYIYWHHFWSRHLCIIFCKATLMKAEQKKQHNLVYSLSQSYISSGISCGLRIPGTDIWSLCFSSCAWRKAASLSSKNKSALSSPANSCKEKINCLK